MTLIQGPTVILGSNTATRFLNGFSGIAALSNGTFAATVRTVDSNGLNAETSTQIYNEAGLPVGEVLGESALSADRVTNVFGLQNGGFILGRVKDGGSAGTFPYEFPAENDVLLTLYDNFVGAVTSDTPGPASQHGDQYDPRFAALSNGNIAVTWTTFGGAISARIFDSALTPITGNISVGSFKEADLFRVAMGALPGGRFVVSWSEYQNASRLTDIKARIYNADGTPLAASFLVNTVVGGIQRVVDVAELGAGKFAVIWENEGGQDDANAQVFDANGLKVGSAFNVGTGYSIDAGNYRALGLGDGRFAFIESAMVGGDNLNHLNVWIYGLDGKACGKPIEIDTSSNYVPVSRIGSIDIELLSKTKILISWVRSTLNDLDVSSSTAYVKTIDFTGFEGTLAADTWIGGNRAETMNGAAGNDKFFGGGGADSLSGGAGDDTLNGGAGPDMLNGGTGSDAASYYGDSAIRASLTNPGSNAGAARGDTYTSVENLVGSSYNDVLTGDSRNNRISGGLGADTIDGQSGNDILAGGRGFDRLAGGAGADRFYFSSRLDGGDTISFFESADFLVFAKAAFGGLAYGTLDPNQFRARASDNLAQDPTDHFIYRYSDDTLWFDTNANAAGGLTKMVDFSNNFVLRAADILIL